MKLFNTDESASEKARSLKLIEKRVVNRTPFGVRHIRKFLPLALLFAAIIVVGITDTFQGFASFIAVLLVCATYSISNRIAPFLAAAVSSVAMIWWLSRGVADDEQAFISLILTLIFVWGAAAVVNYIHFLENEFVEQGWRLKLGLEAGNIGIFRWHLETGKIYGQGNLGDLFDLPAGATFHQDDLIRKVHPDDVEIVERIAKNAREHGDEYEAEFRIVTGAGSYRWIASRGILTSSGKSSRRFLTGANWDITHQKQQDDHIRNILDGVDAIALLLSPDGSVVSVNRFTLNLTNEKESALIGRKVWEIFDCDEETAEKLRQSTDQPDSDAETMHDITVRVPERGERHFALQVSVLRNPSGTVKYLVPFAIDFTDRLHAEERAGLMLRELNHRIKNLFSVTTALINLSARHATDVDSFVRSTLDRLRSLHNAHSLSGTDTTRPDQYRLTVSLHELIDTMLDPWKTGDSDKITVKGDDWSLTPGKATAFGIIFHELASNYSTHGAFLHENGRLLITTERHGEDCRIVWKEEGFGAIAVPEKERFGLSIIRTMTQNYLDGKVDYRFDDTGFCVEITGTVKEDGLPTV